MGIPLYAETWKNKQINKTSITAMFATEIKS